MTYTPIRTVVRSGLKLTESTDLTVLATSFAGRDAYLVVERDQAKHVIDLNQALLFEVGLTPTATVATVFTSRLSDAFVARYETAQIPLLNEKGFYDKRLRVFCPESYKSYTVQFTSMETPNIVDDATRKGFLDDLVISNEEGDDLSSSLVAVNGVFHRTSVLDNKIYVHDGFRTMRLTNRKDVTIVDTHRLGGHTIVPLTSSNVTQSEYNSPAIITSPMSLRNKTVFLVIDGYFYHQDTPVFKLLNDTTLRLEMGRLPLISQFRHNPRTIYQRDLFGSQAVQTSRKYEDDYAATFLDKRIVPSETFQSRDFQYSRLTHYHSFLVVLNAPAVFTQTIDLLSTGTPKFYLEPSNRLASGMLSTTSGRCPSYLIWRDVYQRNNLYLGDSENDLDLQDQSIDPQFIPSLTVDLPAAANLPVKLVDYFVA